MNSHSFTSTIVYSIDICDYSSLALPGLTLSGTTVNLVQGSTVSFTYTEDAFSATGPSVCYDFTYSIESTNTAISGLSISEPSADNFQIDLDSTVASTVSTFKIKQEFTDCSGATCPEILSSDVTVNPAPCTCPFTTFSFSDPNIFPTSPTSTSYEFDSAAPYAIASMVQSDCENCAVQSYSLSVNTGASVTTSDTGSEL